MARVENTNFKLKLHMKNKRKRFKSFTSKKQKICDTVVNLSLSAMLNDQNQIASKPRDENVKLTYFNYNHGSNY